MAKNKQKTKQERLRSNYLGVIAQFTSGKSYSAMTRKELCDRLDIPPDHHSIIASILKEFVREGQLMNEGGRYFATVAQENIVTGVLSTHPRGFGFVRPDNAAVSTQDIFIPKHLIWNAVHGDRVEVAIDPENISPKGPEGEIISILERGRTHLAGTVTRVRRAGEAQVYVPLLGQDRAVNVQLEEGQSLNAGDRIVMKVLEWHDEDEGEATVAQLVRVIGNIEDPTCDVPAAIEEFELRDKFPTKTVAEARTFGTRVKPSDMKDREDLRELICVTIDPDTAKDFDDAISLTQDKSGNFELGVHIADVSHYVQSDTQLDKEALRRCNSTYFPGTVLPMLPPELSNNLCSLRPNVNRLAASVLMTLSPDGKLLKYRMTRSVIKSRKRYTYREAKQILEGKASPHSALLKRMEQLCHALRQRRFQRGSLDLSLPEAVVLVDEQSMPTGIDYVEYDITHQMIEEFMLKANEVVAKHLSDAQKQLVFRIHQEPGDENLKGFVSLAEFFGYKLSTPPTSKELQALFDEAKEHSYGEYLASNYIRCMKMAYYSRENVGHYGLSLDHYCHFTSPIRRYADLVVHRVLFGGEIARDELDRVTTKLSEQERVSARAENSVKLLKKLRWLRLRQEQDPHTQYDAVVTSVKPFGVAFDIPSLMFDGFLHVKEMGGDYYAYDARTMQLLGEKTRTCFQAGTQLTVMLSDLNLTKLEARWEMIPDQQPGDEPGQQRQAPRKPMRRGPGKKGRRRR